MRRGKRGVKNQKELIPVSGYRKKACDKRFRIGGNRMFSIKNFLRLILILILPVSVMTESLNSGQDRVLLAQNQETEKTDSEKSEPGAEMPPFPPAKISITTEKPVKTVSDEETPEQDSEENMQSPITGESIEKDKQPPFPRRDKSRVVPSSQTPLPQTASSGAVTAPGEDRPEKVPPVVPKDTSSQGKISTQLLEELSIFNVATSNFRTMKVIIDDNYNLRGMVYGDGRGYIRLLEADNNGKFKEVWKSPPLNSVIRGLFIRDLDGNGDSEIVAYTVNGNIYIYGYNSHDLIYKTPEGTYQNINCMVVANMDRDPQMELFFIGVRPGTGQPDNGEPAGNLIQFDTKTQFDEWTSSELYTATDMLVGNVDTDSEPEIILNTGEILSIRFKNVKWKSTVDFGSRLYLIDMDDDGILELVTEYDESYVRIIDVDQRQEKW
jgi:hypothetical protein